MRAQIIIKNCLHCDETLLVRESRVAAGRGKFCSRSCKAKFVHTGRKNSKETLLKMSDSAKRRGVSEEHIERFKKLRIGTTLTEEHKRKIGDASRGPRNHNYGRFGPLSHRWKGGAENRKILDGKRRAMELGAEGNHTAQEWLELKRFYNFMCLCCKKEEPSVKLTEDHVIPLSKGGSNYISNIQPLCQSCNSRKMVACTDYRVMAFSV